MKYNKSQLISLAAFAATSVAASQMIFTPFVAGQNSNFTFFDLYAPIAGGLFGPVAGVLAVLITQISNLLLRQTFTLAGILHLFPVMFGVWYFGSNKRLINLIPLIAIAYFVINPTSREVWYYSLFWLIPMLCHPFKEKSLLARALGATFTTHAVGGLLWVYFFNPPAVVWAGLIPIVIMERLVFALTSAIMYVILKKVYEVYSNQNAGHAPAAR